MRSRVPFFGFLLVASSIALPAVAYAGVPFFGPIIPEAQANCAASWGMVLTVVNNLISFALTMTIVFVAPLMIAYSGFLYVVNPVDPSGISKAKTILRNTIVGTVIALAAWMIVDAVMAVLYDPEKAGETWASLIYGKPSDLCLPQAGITGVPVTVQPTIGVVPTPPRVTITPTAPVTPSGPGAPSVSTFRPTFSQTEISSKARAASNYRSQACAAASREGIADQCNRILGIIGVESSGNAQANGDAGEIGLMQLLPTTAATVGVTACSGSSNTSPSAACIAALRDPTTNINAGTRLYAQAYQRYSNADNATAAYNGGAGTGTNASGTRPPMSQSRDCPGLYAWQCPINPGELRGTQGYVANVDAVEAQFNSRGI